MYTQYFFKKIITHKESQVKRLIITICEYGGMLIVITQLWVVPQNSLFFQNKNQKNKIKAGNVEKAGREIKLQFLEKIQGLIVQIQKLRINLIKLQLCSKIKKKYKFKIKLNDYWKNLHKN